MDQPQSVAENKVVPDLYLCTRSTTSYRLYKIKRRYAHSWLQRNYGEFLCWSTTLQRVSAVLSMPPSWPFTPPAGWLTGTVCVCLALTQVCWSGPSGPSWLWWPSASQAASSSCTSSVKSTCSYGAASRPSTASSPCRTALRKDCTALRPGAARAPSAGMKLWRFQRARPPRQHRRIRWTQTPRSTVRWRRHRTQSESHTPQSTHWPRGVGCHLILIWCSLELKDIWTAEIRPLESRIS